MKKINDQMRKDCELNPDKKRRVLITLDFGKKLKDIDQSGLDDVSILMDDESIIAASTTGGNVLQLEKVNGVSSIDDSIDVEPDNNI